MEEVVVLEVAKLKACQMELNTVYRLLEHIGEKSEFVIRGPKVFDVVENGTIVVTPVFFCQNLRKWRVVVSNLTVPVSGNAEVQLVDDPKNLA